MEEVKDAIRIDADSSADWRRVGAVATGGVNNFADGVAGHLVDILLLCVSMLVSKKSSRFGRGTCSIGPALIDLPDSALSSLTAAVSTARPELALCRLG